MEPGMQQKEKDFLHTHHANANIEKKAPTDNEKTDRTTKTNVEVAEQVKMMKL